MNIQFTKMQGAGNDLVMIDGYSTPIALTANQIKRISDRHFGVGCDQLLMVERTNTPNVDFRYRIFNADGNEVEHCGNGARCFVRFVVEKGLTQKREIVVETLNGIITLTLHDNNQVTVNMGMPRFAPDAIPFIAENTSHQYDLEVNGETYIISALSMGNPHAVLLVDDVENAPVVPLGTAIEAHPRFPEHVNVGFMQIVNTHEVKLRVFERGSGETLACGTGACAAVVAGIQLGKLISPVKVSARGGELHIAWQGPEFSVMMTGPAESVFTGTISIE